MSNTPPDTPIQSREPIEQFDRYGFLITPDSQWVVDLLEEPTRVRKENERLVKWQHMLDDFDGFQRKHGQKVVQRVLKGIPDAVRGRAWPSFVGPVAASMRLNYEALLNEPLELRIEKQINRDLPRTLPTNEFYRKRDSTSPMPQGCEALGRILHCYANYDKEVGYVQGMNSIAAVPLLYMPEADAFDVFLFVMVRLNYREYFLTGFPRLDKSMSILEHLVANRLPKLHKHLLRHNVSLRSLYPSWLMTLFTYNLPFAAVIRLWDWMLIAGHDVVFAFVLAVLKLIQEDAMKHDNPSSLIEFVMGFSKQLKLEPDFVVNNAQHFKALATPSATAIIQNRKKSTLPAETNLRDS